MNYNRSILVFILFFIIIGGLFSYFEKQSEVQNEVKTVTKLVFEDKVIKEFDNVVIENDEIYIPVDFIKGYIEPNIKISEDKKRVYIKLADKKFELEEESLTKLVKESNIEINFLTKIENDIVYVPSKLVSKLFNIDINYIDTSGVVTVDRYVDEMRLGKVNTKNVKVKTKYNILSFTIDKLSLYEEVRILGESKEWYKVRTSDGYLGFVQKKYIDEYVKKVESINKLNNKRKDFNKDDKLNITWEYVYEKTPDIKDEAKIDGLDIIAPTWFSVSKNGVVINKADMNYVKDAHNKGYNIWGVIDNGFDPDITTKILNDEEIKNKVIAQMAFYTSLYDLDGINIDFENIYYDDKQAFVEFVYDLTKVLKIQNLIVSIDVTVPGGSKRWSKVYDREKLAKIVDYVALMAYDEHWATSPKSGSVASIGWVEKGIVGSLETIPKEKLLLGLPFYTRIWKETVDENGKIKVSSKAIPIKNLEKILEENNAAIVWDDEAGQYFATYESDDSVYKIWIEDVRSIKLKLELARKYGLKGVASWRKGYEYEQVWEVIRAIKEEKNLL